MKKTQTNTGRSRSHRNRLTIQMRSDAGSRLGAVAPREEVLFGTPCLTPRAARGRPLGEYPTLRVVVRVE